MRSRLDCQPHWLIPKNVLSNYFLGLAQSDVHSGSWALSCFFSPFGCVFVFFETRHSFSPLFSHIPVHDFEAPLKNDLRQLLEWQIARDAYALIGCTGACWSFTRAVTANLPPGPVLPSAS